MKVTYLVSVLAALSAGTMAANCNPGYNYCGSSLLNKGSYQPQIDQCLYDNGQGIVDDGRKDLFFCAGGRNGVIKWLGRCTNCVDGGTGNSDYCSSQITPGGFGEQNQNQKELRAEIVWAA
ncbi:MAG: hypothetical protein M1813_000608 [Trichoglossum hirsutum]|nr:MAG: hypothetical protein M1813_000608 [Trichoglossum hirsutum]